MVGLQQVVSSGPSASYVETYNFPFLVSSVFAVDFWGFKTQFVVIATIFKACWKGATFSSNSSLLEEMELILISSYIV